MRICTIKYFLFHGMYVGYLGNFRISQLARIFPLFLLVAPPFFFFLQSYDFFVFSNWDDHVCIVFCKYLLWARFSSSFYILYIASCQPGVKLTSAHRKAQRHRYDRPPSRHRATSMIHDDDDLREIPALLHSTHLIRSAPARDLTRVVLMFTGHSVFTHFINLS